MIVLFMSHDCQNVSTNEVALDLDGGGIRDIVFDQTFDGYLIVSQREGTKNENAFKLWFWDGSSQEAMQSTGIHRALDFDSCVEIDRSGSGRRSTDQLKQRIAIDQHASTIQGEAITGLDVADDSFNFYSQSRVQLCQRLGAIVAALRVEEDASRLDVDDDTTTDRPLASMPGMIPLPPIPPLSPPPSEQAISRVAQSITLVRCRRKLSSNDTR